MSDPRKICVVTGSRAEYGLLHWLMQDLKDDPRVTLQLAVTGMHLAPQFGDTWREIEADGFLIDERVDIGLSGDRGEDIAKAVGRGVIGFAGAFDRLKPDIVVILGDRFEILAAAQAAMFARIPIAHIHGGEVTEGAVDEFVRHAITKMSQLHFVAAEPYRRRVIQMGENPERVFDVGALGVENLRRVQLLDRDAFEQRLGMKLASPTFLVTYHPVTLSESDADNDPGEMLKAFAAFDKARFIFTHTNADAGGQAVQRAINDFAEANRGRCVSRSSLGQQTYLSALKYVDAVVGNSSSGLIEAPAAGVATVNIGDRQKGRLRSQSVIDCAPRCDAIVSAMRKAISSDFRDRAFKLPPVYGSGHTAAAIRDVIATMPLDRLARKPFQDIKAS